MKKVLLGVLIGAVFVCGAETIFNGDQKEKISVGPNEEFGVYFSSNPSTGYMWRFVLGASSDDVFGKGLVQRLEQKDTFVANSNLPGAGGHQTLWFKSVEQGVGSMSFTYKGTWESEGISTTKLPIVVAAHR